MAERSAAGEALVEAAVSALSGGGRPIPHAYLVTISRTAGGMPAMTIVWSATKGQPKVLLDGKNLLAIQSPDPHPNSPQTQPRSKRHLSPDKNFQFVNPALPQITLAERLANPLYDIGDPAAAVLNGVSLQVVETSCSQQLHKSISKQRWYIDPQTHLPVRVDYLVPSVGPIGGQIPVSLTFGQFQQDSSVTYAKSATEDIFGDPATLTVQSIKVGAAALSSLGGASQ